MYDTEDARGYAVVEQEQPRRTHVESELSEQPEIIALIHQAVSELEKRLVGVLRGEDEEKNLVAPVSELLVPTAGRMRDNNDQLRSIRRRLGSMLDRLEL